jgi:hypothetical protein
VKFDIAALDTKTKSEEGVEMKVLSPKTMLPMTDDDKNPVTITLRGRNSTAYKNAISIINDRARERQARNIAPTPESRADDEAEVLAACTIGWTFTEMDGKPFPPTPENIRAFYGNERFTFVHEQASRFVASDGNFLAT